MTSGPLDPSVDAFIDAMCDELAALSSKPATSFAREVAVEAANIVAGIIDADGRQTQSELEAYLDTLGHRLDPPLRATSTELRESNVLAGRAAWLHEPSVMFDLLARADARSATRRSHRYYDLALRLAHVTAALDLVPSPDEIDAISVLRMTMLGHLDSLGVPRPGQPAPATPATPTPSAPSNAVPVEVELPPARSIESLLAELDELVGLANVKREVSRLTSMLQVQQIRAERGLPTMEASKHLVFSGNPGTGKTTVARLLSQIYRAVGVVSKGHLVETDRSKLVAGYVGQTALKTQATLEASLGGMLLIDEAYALARGGENDFGREAIDTLVKFMEDHRDDLAIVAAGYTDEMREFIEANPGLKSRFTRTINFADYTSDELVAIFVGLGEKNRYHCSDPALERVRALVDAEPRTLGFGNARFVRNLFETAVAHQAMRLAPLADPTDEQLTTLTADDIVPVDD
ncbi:MAG: AAA family ATPase [Ilumatobacteraceae bacterium]